MQSKLSDKAEADVQPQTEGILTMELIKQALVSDEFSQQIDQALVEGKSVPYFKYKDSVLYHELTDASEEPKIVVPLSLR
jgi:hypothetical protein